MWRFPVLHSSSPSLFSFLPLIITSIFLTLSLYISISLMSCTSYGDKWSRHIRIKIFALWHDVVYLVHAHYFSREMNPVTCIIPFFVYFENVNLFFISPFLSLFIPLLFILKMSIFFIFYFSRAMNPVTWIAPLCVHFKLSISELIAMVCKLYAW